MLKQQHVVNDVVAGQPRPGDDESEKETKDEAGGPESHRYAPNTQARAQVAATAVPMNGAEAASKNRSPPAPIPRKKTSRKLAARRLPSVHSSSSMYPPSAPSGLFATQR